MNLKLLKFNILIVLWFAALGLLVLPHFEGQFFMWKIILNESNGMFEDYHQFNDLFLWQELYALLYNYMPEVPWFTIITQLLVILSSHVLVSILYLLYKKRQVPRFLFWCSALTLLSILSYNLLWVNHNRASFLVVGASLITIWYNYSFSSWSITGKSISYFLSIICFSMGFFYRPEAGLAASILMICLIILLQRSLDLRLLLRYIPIFLILIASFSYYHYQVANSSSFYYQLEPNVEYDIMDKRRIVDIGEMENQIDSARYFAASNWMLGDVKETTPAFLRSIIESNGATNSPKFSALKEVSNHNLKLNTQTFLWENRFVLAILTFLVFYLLASKKYTGAIILIVFIGFSLVLIVGSFSINYFSRVTQPLMALLVFGSLVLFSQNGKKYNHGIFLIIFSLVSIAFTWGTFKIILNEEKSLSHKEQHIISGISEILDKNYNREYVFVLDNFYVANTGSFQSFTYFDEKKMLIPAMGQFSGNPALIQYNSELTSCDVMDFLCIMKFIENNKENAIIFSSANRVKVFQKYLKDRYGFELNIPLDQAQILYDNSLYWTLE